jgi:hypothetical protein
MLHGQADRVVVPPIGLLDFYCNVKISTFILLYYVIFDYECAIQGKCGNLQTGARAGAYAQYSLVGDASW